MNRLDKKFEELKQAKKKAFIAFITAGDPSLKVTEELVCSFERSNVDIVELGVPFSDPLADGPTIQAASQRALANGVTLKKILNTVKNIRIKTEMPICLMTYYNPVFHYGEEKFVEDARKCGVDGLIIPDLPHQEAKILIASAKKNGVSTILFLTPTTTKKRMKEVVDVATGFIYYVSLTGVTGERKALPTDVAGHVKAAKKISTKPICIGFGISNAAQVKAMSKIADGVIVGSAIVKEINKNAGRKDIVKKVSSYVAKLRGL
ncbi:MAG: tryptophan synthase subunit alpha [Candidatus Omnitrophica bacterium]|nr:tryptophan synthase subunit alpha [Candidatus Omnitrophota bacterium]MBU1996080.1 tryptophan synthase subunit alpha [Candidatus Omnitrophota bacterium]